MELLTIDIAEAMAKLSRDEALAHFAAEDVPCGMVRELDELHTDRQVITNQTLVERDHPICGRLGEPRPAARFGPEPLAPAGPLPRSGASAVERRALELAPRSGPLICRSVNPSMA